MFQKAKLQGSFQIIVEEGSQSPKTTLGQRAAIQHLQSLGFIDATDPDQRYEVLKVFGQTKLSPSLDIHMQAALRKQQAFEEWAADDMAIQQTMVQQQEAVMQYEQQLATLPPPEPTKQIDPLTGQAVEMPPDQAALQAQIPPPPSITTYTPLKWLGWYKADVHKQEFLKWANSDTIVELLKEKPGIESMLTAHLQEIDMALQEQMMLAAGPQPPQGAGMAMQNSNREAGGLGAMPGKKGAAQEAV
jgi:hypothetical protein